MAEIAKSSQAKERTIKNYLSDTDEEKYATHPKLPQDPAARKEKILRLWRTAYNCAFGVAILLIQKEAVITKILLFGR